MIKNRRHLTFVDFPGGYDCAVEVYGDGWKDQHEELVKQTWTIKNIEFQNNCYWNTDWNIMTQSQKGFFRRKNRLWKFHKIVKTFSELIVLRGWKKTKMYNEQSTYIFQETHIFTNFLIKAKDLLFVSLCPFFPQKVPDVSRKSITRNSMNFVFNPKKERNSSPFESHLKVGLLRAERPPADQESGQHSKRLPDCPCVPAAAVL